MLLMIKSHPESAEARRALKMASEMPAEVVLIQDGGYHVLGNRLEGFSGMVHVLEDDMRMRGLAPDGDKIKTINYHDLVDLMAEAEKVAGIF